MHRRTNRDRNRDRPRLGSGGGRARRLRLGERGAGVVDEIPFRGAVARLLRLTKCAPRLQEKLVGLGPSPAQRALRLVADSFRLTLRSSRRARGIRGGDACLLQSGAELGSLSLGLEQGALERAMKLREVRVRASQDAFVET